MDGRTLLDLSLIHIFQPDIDVELLTVNPYSRPGTETNKITGIVVHYTANPGSTAMDNRNYFEGLKDSHEDVYKRQAKRGKCWVSVSAIGLDRFTN